MKYMGSKSRLSKVLYEVMEPSLQNATAYVEPFAGGLNMTSYVAERFNGKIIASDIHEYLIAMWDALLNGWIPPEQITKEEYYHIKNNKDDNKALTGWVGFNCSYAGKWFAGFAGITKTKTGIRDYQAEAHRNIMKQLESIKDIQLFNKPYWDLDIPNSSVVYCDPPYKGTTGYRDSFDHDKFWAWCRAISKECKVFISEYNAPEDFDCIWSKTIKSSLSANNQSGTVTSSIEKLFTLK